MKKLLYHFLTLVISSTILSSCKCKPDSEKPVDNPPAVTSRTLWMTSFEGNQTGTVKDSTNSIFTGSYSYSFGVTTGGRVKGGSTGVPAAVHGDSIYQMKTTAAGQYYGGGFGWEPGAGNSLDTLDINDAFEFSYNFNGNVNTNIKLQMVDPVDGDVFIFTIPNVATAGWNTASVTLDSFTFDTTDPANNNGQPHDKIIDVSGLTAFKFIYENPTAGGLDLELYIDDIKIVDHDGGAKVLNGN